MLAGKSLEQIDEIFEGTKHSDAPNLQRVMDGKETVDVMAIEKSLHQADVMEVKE